MLCPKCNIECRCENNGILLVDDDTPDKQTKVFRSIRIICRNPRCRNFNGVVDIIKTQLK